MIDRLKLDEETIDSMVDGLREVAALPDPVGKIPGMCKAKWIEGWPYTGSFRRHRLYL